MSTLERLQGIFRNDLNELKELSKKGWFVLPMSRTVKEEHLGRCCYLAEEFLNPTELRLLKLQLGLDERQWHIFKTKICK